MKDCTDCASAEWRKTASGRLHPSGDGRCLYEPKMPAIPASKSWFMARKPELTYGFINRRRLLDKDCPCYQKKETK